MALDLDFTTSADRFHAQFPQYASTAVLDSLRTVDYARLDASDSVNLDFTGAGLHAASHIREHTDFLADSVFGNPHSASPSTSATTATVERARAYVHDLSHKRISAPTT